MWIDRKTYEAALDTNMNMRLENVKLQEECRVLNRVNHQLETTMDWFRVRITQLEHERAQLLFNYTGVKIQTPEIVQAPKSAAEILQGTASFEDLGDVEAEKQGVGWDAEGLLAIRRQAQRS